MSTEDNCPICDRPHATEPLTEDQCHVRRIEANLTVPTSKLGWIETEHTRREAKAACHARRVDWRARYLELRQRIAAVIATTMVALAVMVGACGGTPGTGPGPDADPAAPDADPTAPDARIACLGGTCDLPDADPAAPDAAIDAGLEPDAGRPRLEGEACDLLYDQCATGYTCRWTGTPSLPFACQLFGAAGEGGDCTATGNAGCGADMGCFPVGGGKSKCYLFCDTSHPERRCHDAQVCEAVELGTAYPATTGVCF